MDSIGIIGITAEGASICYKTIVNESSKKLGQFTNPEIILLQPNFNEILQAQKSGDWDKVAEIIINAGKKLITLGVGKIVIPANSIHFAIDKIKKELNVQVVNVLEVVKDICLEKDFKKALVLGVGITMTGNLYKEILFKNSIGYELPSDEDIKILDEIIYSELVLGKTSENSTKKILEIISKGKQRGCDVAVLACTELPMVINEKNSPIPIIDTTREIAISAIN